MSGAVLYQHGILSQRDRLWIDLEWRHPLFISARRGPLFCVGRPSLQFAPGSRVVWCEIHGEVRSSSCYHKWVKTLLPWSCACCKPWYHCPHTQMHVGIERAMDELFNEQRPSLCCAVPVCLPRRDPQASFRPEPASCNFHFWKVFALSFCASC